MRKDGKTEVFPPLFISQHIFCPSILSSLSSSSSQPQYQSDTHENYNAANNQNVSNTNNKHKFALHRHTHTCTHTMRCSFTIKLGRSSSSSSSSVLYTRHRPSAPPVRLQLMMCIEYRDSIESTHRAMQLQRWECTKMQLHRLHRD